MWDADKRTPGGQTASTSLRSNQGKRERVDYNNSQVFFTPLTSVINNNEQRENKMIDSGGDRGDH